jgi:hypothetical protein
MNYFDIAKRAQARLRENRAGNAVDVGNAGSPPVPATVDLAEVERRAIVSKHQIEQAAGGAIPFLALPEAPNVGFGHCGSCGVVLSPPATHRCRTCRAAVSLALGLPDPGARE